ncbi:hypothetical protein VTJ04DRAFT_9189 [Mycothermus thermophilus]|uniref:uncharacterized protein n=1 Tax=Humicola insolens TaxID=85995 RepID=UPI00374393F0
MGVGGIGSGVRVLFLDSRKRPGCPVPVSPHPLLLSILFPARGRDGRQACLAWPGAERRYPEEAVTSSADPEPQTPAPVLPAHFNTWEQKKCPPQRYVLRFQHPEDKCVKETTPKTTQSYRQRYHISPTSSPTNPQHQRRRRGKYCVRTRKKKRIKSTATCRVVFPSTSLTPTCDHDSPP